MSFNRPLTGQSQIYATVALNTNVCANSVSTVYLSATNASFTNITTNTWTTGNVSTPNVIATSGYFSTAFMSVLNLSIFNISQAYISNLSTSNISNASLISTSTLSAYITNVSTQNACLIATSTIYSQYNYMSNISVDNLCISTQLDVDGDVIGVNGRFEHVQIKNAGGNTQYVIEQIGSSTVHSVENSGVLGIDFKRLGVSMLSLNNTSCVIYQPIYSTSANISNISSFRVSTSYLNTCAFNMCNSTTPRLNVNEFQIRNFSFQSSPTFFPVNPTKLSLLYTTNLFNSFIEYEGLTLNVCDKNAWIDAGVHTPFTITHNGVCALTHDRTPGSRGWYFYDSIYSSYQNYISNISVSNLSVGNMCVSVISTCHIYLSGGLDIDGDVIANNAHFTEFQVAQAGGGDTVYTIQNTSQFIIQQIENSAVSAIAFVNYLGQNLFQIGNNETYAFKPLYASTGNFSTINSSSSVLANASITNLSATNFTVGTLSSSNISIENLSIITAMTAVSSSINTLNSTSTYISNLSALNASITNLSTTLISNSSRISTSSISVSNLSVATKLTATNISMTNGGQIFGNFDIYSSGLANISDIVCGSLGVNGLYSSFRNTCAISSYVSYVSVSNLSGGTLQATTANFSTLNVSSFALTNLSLTNLSVATKATITSASVSDLSVSQITFGNTSLWGTLSQAGNIMFLNSQGGTNAIWFATSGTQRLELSQTQAKFNVCILAQRGNFSTLSVSTFNPANITTTTMTASTVNASAFNVSTFNPATVNACNSNICNISTSYLSSYSNDMTLLRAGAITAGGVTIKSDYDTPAVAFTTSNNFLMGRLGFDIYTSEFNINTYTTGGIYRTTLDTPDVYVSTSTLNVCDYNGSLVAQINTNTSRFSISNISTSYVSTSDITSTDGNISYLYGETFYPNYIIAGGGDFSGDVNFSNISIQKINNSFSTITTSQPLTLYSVSNTSTTGLRVPTYIDSQDLGAITMGFNQTTGFINCCRSTRIYGNILVDGNVNALVDTADLGIGRNLASGNIVIGNTTMTGNISIDTTGDIVFGCDRRSTWNTSNIVPFSTQLGSGYSVVGNINSGNVSGTNTCRIYYPTPTNISLLNLPVGLYLCSMVGSIKGFSGYNAISANAYAGICYGTNASFTDANTTRINTNYIFGPNLYSNASTATVIPMNFTFPFNVSTTGQKVGFFIQYQAANLATAGGMVINFFSCAVIKIA